jgi:hypothetical protein
MDVSVQSATVHHLKLVLMSLYLNFLNLKGFNPKNRVTITLLKVSFKTQLPSFNCCHLASARCSARLGTCWWFFSSTPHSKSDVGGSSRGEKNKLNAAVAGACAVNAGP